jgi:hypothetical protein
MSFNMSDGELRREYSKQALPISGYLRAVRKCIDGEPSLITEMIHRDRSSLLFNLYGFYHGVALGIVAKGITGSLELLADKIT